MPGFAVVFVPRADAVGDVDGGRGLGVVGHQQHLQAVRQPEFGDAFDAGDLHHAMGQRDGGLRLRGRRLRLRRGDQGRKRQQQGH